MKELSIQHAWSEKLRSLFFVLVLFIVFAVNGVLEMVPLRPVGVHMWAMCDRASIARNYYQESMNFFLPRVHETREYDGITGLEFPFVNYGAAVLYSIFGFHESLYRLLMLVILVAGLYSAFLLGRRITGNSIAGVIPPLLLLTSPVLNYYAASFIPDVASLGFALCAWYLFFRIREHRSASMIILFTVLMSVACLIKITSVINIVVMAALLILDRIGFISKGQNTFRSHYIILATLAVSALSAVAWYRYAAWLSNEHHCSVFLMTSRPAQNFNEIKEVVKHIREIWLDFYFPPVMNWFILLSLVVFGFLSPRLNRLLWLTTCGLLCGNAAFFIFMLHQFRDHDYYIITLLPALLFMWLALADFFSREVKAKPFRYAVPVLILALIAVSSAKVRAHIGFRHQTSCWLYTWDRFTDLLDIEPFVDRIGVGRDQKVLSVYDRSPNIVLYYLNRKGWSLPPNAGDDEISKILEHKPDWLVLNDSSLFAKDGLSDYFNPVPEKKGSVLFYRKK